MEDISEWKYPKLLNRAKELGIVFENPKPKKSIVVEAIETQMRIQQATMELMQPQTPAPSKEKKKGRGRPKAKTQEVADEESQTPVEEPDVAVEKPKKTKKKVTKAKKDKPEVINESTPAKRSTRGASAAPQAEEEVVIEKPASRVGRKKKMEKEAPLEQPEEKDVDVVKVTKKTKKAAKATAHEHFSAAQVLETIVTENTQPPKTPRKSVYFSESTNNGKGEEKDTSGKDFELRLDEDTNDALNPVGRADATVVKHKMTEASLLTSDDDEPVVKSRRNTPSKTPVARSPRSVSTDSRFINNKTLNITNDISSTTFNKTPNKSNGQATVSCASFYNVPSVAPVEEPKTAQPVVQQAPAIVIQPPISEPQGVAKPKTGGARIVRPKQLVSEAVIQDVIAVAPAAVDEPTKKMEIVQREAGPRIVKPKVLAENEAVTSKNDPKIKKRVASADQVALKTLKMNNNAVPSPAVDKKTTASSLQRKPSITVPDFKAIHEKEAKKMQSLEEHVQKKLDRQNKLLAKPAPTAEAPSTTNPEVKSKLKTPKSVVTKPLVSGKTPSRLLAKTPTSVKAIKPTKTPGSSKVIKPNKTPKLLKPVVKATNTAAVSNGEKEVKKPTIPKLSSMTKSKPEPVNDENKPIVVEENPSTPVMSSRRISNFNSASKTPTSTVKPSLSSLNQSATKKPTNFVFGANGPSTSSLLATSSFNRRKSYDLNASLSKPLGYKPHEGKLKPIDFNAKSIFLKKMQEPLRPNNTNNITSTISVDTTVVIDKKSSTPKALAPGQTKRRQSNILLSSIRPISSISITGARESNAEVALGSKTHLLKQSVRQHSKDVTDKFRLNENKIRQEHRMSTVAKSRQLAAPVPSI